MVLTKRRTSGPPQPQVYLLPEEPSLQHLQQQLRHLQRTMLRSQTRHAGCSEGQGHSGGHRGHGARQLHQEMGERGPRWAHVLGVHGVRPVGLPGVHRALPDLPLLRPGLRHLQSRPPVETMRFPQRGGCGGVRPGRAGHDVDRPGVGGERGEGAGENENVLRPLLVLLHVAEKPVVP